MAATKESARAPDRLSDLERAVCYYTLPRTTTSLTPALVLVYALCLLEALGALIYGVASENRAWTMGGTVALAAIVVFGVLVFMIRGFVSEIQRTRALAAAHNAPDANPEETDLPDPFADHTLLRRPVRSVGEFSVWTGNDNVTLYTVKAGTRRRSRALLDMEGKERLEVAVQKSLRSFLLIEGLPGRLEVAAGGERVAEIRHQFNLRVPTVEIRCKGPEPKEYMFRNGGIYFEDRLVGRIYEVRQQLYLDVETVHLNEGILGLFTAMF